MEALILALVVSFTTVQGAYREVLLEAKVREIRALDVSLEEKGQLLLPFIWEGMTLAQLE